MINIMKEITTRLAEVNGIVSGYDGGAIPFEQAYALALHLTFEKGPRYSI